MRYLPVDDNGSEAKLSENGMKELSIVESDELSYGE